MAPPPTKKPVASKNIFAILSEESEDPLDQIDASTDGGVSLSREPTPRPEAPAFTRAPPGSFGDRLATARGALPSDVPPPPPRAAPTPSASAAPTAVGFGAGPSTLATAPGLVNPSLGYKPRFGGTPGSYTSPYDIGGKTPGDPRLSTNSISWEEFERKHGSGRHLLTPSTAFPSSAASEHTATPGSSRGGVSLGNISFGQMPPVDVKGKGKVPASAAAERVTPAIPKDAETRFLWFGPYTMVRHACERQKEIPAAQILAGWFEHFVPKDHMKTVLRDQALPNIVYAVEIPMTTENWDRYHQLLALFPDARDLKAQLDKGYHELDKVTASHVGAAGVATWPQLTEEGVTMEDRLQQLVEGWNLGVPWDLGRGPANRPAVWPVEMGGTLEDYPLRRE